MIVYPDYYKDFRCIGGSCRHNCCIGWEIDIDEKKLSYYQKTPGPLGKRLRENISLKPTPHFVLTPEERCPFLNENNLCDLIIALGDEALCDICREHPRFYNQHTGHIECGLGLCCEQAGRLILGKKEKTILLTDGGAYTDDTDPILKERRSIIDILQERDLTISQRIQKALDKLGLVCLPLDSRSYAKELYLLERLDPAWSRLLEEYIASEETDQTVKLAFEKEIDAQSVSFEQFAVYLVYRHYATAFDEDDACARSLFALQSTAFFFDLALFKWHLYQKVTMEDLVELARLFSSEIEYSEENTEALFDLFYSYL